MEMGEYPAVGVNFLMNICFFHSSFAWQPFFGAPRVTSWGNVRDHLEEGPFFEEFKKFEEKEVMNHTLTLKRLRVL